MHEAVLADQMDKYFPGDVLERHEWVERYYERYDDLRTIGPRACRMNVGATASLARDLYFDSGGMDTSLKLGEDISLGYRLGEAGAVFLPDREARSWHLGRTHVMKRRAEVNDYNDCFLSDRLPELRNKRRAGRLYAVPYLEVVLDTTGLPYGSVVATVDALLGGTLPDLTVTLVGRWSELDDSRIHPLDDPMLDTRLISASFAGDPRVQLVEALPEGRCPAMFRMTLENAEWAPTHKTVARLLHNMERTHHGLRIVRMPDGSTARIERTAAVSRAHHVIKSGEFLDDVLDELFGAWTFEAAEVGFWPCQEVHRARMQGTAGEAEDPATAWDHADVPLAPSREPGRRPGEDRPTTAEGRQPRRPAPRADVAVASAGLVTRRWRPCWAVRDAGASRRCGAPMSPIRRPAREPAVAAAARGRRPSDASSSSSAPAAAAPAPCRARCRPSACTSPSRRSSPTRPTPRASASRSGSSTSTPSCSSAATSRCPTPGRRPGSRPASSPTSSGCAPASTPGSRSSSTSRSGGGPSWW